MFALPVECDRFVLIVGKLVVYYCCNYNYLQLQVPFQLLQREGLE